MQIPPKTLAESQMAYWQIQRYQNSASPAKVFGILLFTLAAGPLIARSLAFFLLALVITTFLVFLHLYQRRNMKKKADDAQKRLDLLRDKYGSEIDVVAEKALSFPKRWKLRRINK